MSEDYQGSKREEVFRCMSLLIDIDEEGFSPRALRSLADRRALPHRVELPVSSEEERERIPLKLHRGALSEAEDGEDSEFWLKIYKKTDNLRFPEEQAANHHLTMQIAEQIFDLQCAPNGSVFLKNGSLAYLSRRIDRAPDGSNLAIYDLSELERTRSSAEEVGSFEELIDLLRAFCGAAHMERWRLFRRIIFGYLMGYGAMCSSSFSLRESSFGDLILAPVEDFSCTALHDPGAPRQALDLYRDQEVPRDVETYGFITGSDLVELGRRFGLSRRLSAEAVDQFVGHERQINQLLERSFLSVPAKKDYQAIVDDRRRALQI